MFTSGIYKTQKNHRLPCGTGAHMYACCMSIGYLEPFVHTKIKAGTWCNISRNIACSIAQQSCTICPLLLPLYNSSRTALTQTPKGTQKQFELAGVWVSQYLVLKDWQNPSRENGFNFKLMGSSSLKPSQKIVIYRLTCNNPGVVTQRNFEGARNVASCVLTFIYQFLSWFLRPLISSAGQTFCTFFLPTRLLFTCTKVHLSLITIITKLFRMICCGMATTRKPL